MDTRIKLIGHLTNWTTPLAMWWFLPYNTLNTTVEQFEPVEIDWEVEL